VNNLNEDVKIPPEAVNVGTDMDVISIEVPSVDALPPVAALDGFDNVEGKKQGADAPEEQPAEVSSFKSKSDTVVKDKKGKIEKDGRTHDRVSLLAFS